MTRLREVSEITETALGWALELTRSEVGFISVAGASESADQVFARARDGHRNPSQGEVEKLLRGATTESNLVHLLQSGGRRIGLAGVTRDAPYTAAERNCFAIFANQLGSMLEVATLGASDAMLQLKTQLEARTDELSQMVRRLQTVDAARQLLLRNVVTAQDIAAKRFAGELHDDALQNLTAAELHLQRARNVSGADQATALAEAESLLVQTEESLRRLLFEVRPPALESPGGLEATIRERTAMLKALTDAEVELELGLPDDLSYEIRSTVFRQVAEAVTNIEKHSRATKVQISLKMADGEILGVVADNGQGFVVAERNNLPGHLGLLSLKERAILAGGWYKIESEPGSGTRIEFGLPTA